MERETLNRLRRAGKETVAELVRDHHRALVALVTPLVGPDDAEEVVQGAWLKAWGGLPSFEGRSSVRTWLSRIALNESRMHLRKRRRGALPAPGNDDVQADPLAALQTDSGFLRDCRYQYPGDHENG